MRAERRPFARVACRALTALVDAAMIWRRLSTVVRPLVLAPLLAAVILAASSCVGDDPSVGGSPDGGRTPTEGVADAGALDAISPPGPTLYKPAATTSQQ